MLNSPVQVLGRSLTRRDITFTSKRPDGKRRESLVGSDGRSGTRSREALKNTNGPAKISAELSRRSTLATLPTPHQPNSAAVTYTAAIQTASPASTRPEGPARIESESLPGQNKIIPNLDNAKIDTPILPGVNQDTSNMGEAPQPVLPAAVTSGLPPSPGPLAMTVDKPLPGQNQVMPPLPPGFPGPNPPSGSLSDPGGPGAGPPGLSPPGSPPPSPPISSAPPGPPGPSGPPKSPMPRPLMPGPPMMPPMMPGLAPPAAAASPPPLPPPPAPLAMTTSSSISTTTSTSTMKTPSKTSKQTSTPVSSTSLSLSSVTSFVTLTRSEQGKGNSSPTPIPQSIDSRTTTATPQAIAVGQSLTVIFSSTGAIAATSSTATAAADTQDGSVLHPTMRTLLIVFVILGKSSLTELRQPSLTSPQAYCHLSSPSLHL